MCPLDKILAQDFEWQPSRKSWGGETYRLRRLSGNCKTLHSNHKHMDDGDYDAAIAAASVTVSHIQSLAQEAGFEDERLGLFDFDVSSA